MIVTGEETALIEQRTGIELQAVKVRPNRFALKGKCPFLTSSNECSIYDIRPCQCRLYHCGKLKNTDDRRDSLADIRILILENSEYRQYKEKMDAEAAAWGNRHGWNWRRM
jgi:Fe-S-cluster containining protein